MHQASPSTRMANIRKARHRGRTCSPLSRHPRTRAQLPASWWPKNFRRHDCPNCRSPFGARSACRAGCNWWKPVGNHTQPQCAKTPSQTTSPLLLLHGDQERRWHFFMQAERNERNNVSTRRIAGHSSRSHRAGQGRARKIRWPPKCPDRRQGLEEYKVQMFQSTWPDLRRP